MDHRVFLAQEKRQWTEAERLQRLCLEWDRRHTSQAVSLSDAEMTPDDKGKIRLLAESLVCFGDILLKQNNSECVRHYQEAIGLCQRIDYTNKEGFASFQLGHSFQEIPGIRDFDQAERWYRRTLELWTNNAGQASCLGQLGALYYSRFENTVAEMKELMASQAAKENIIAKATKAIEQFVNVESCCLRALTLIPEGQLHDVGAIHNQLGIIYKEAHTWELGQFLEKKNRDFVELALKHYREAIRVHELEGDDFAAGSVRYNVAALLHDAGRLSDAREYADSAMRDFEGYGDRAAVQMQKTKELINEIDQNLQT
jgi:tetratricopeptide (TPR) repeat protein